MLVYLCVVVVVVGHGRIRGVWAGEEVFHGPTCPPLLYLALPLAPALPWLGADLIESADVSLDNSCDMEEWDHLQQMCKVPFAKRVNELFYNPLVGR